MKAAGALTPITQMRPLILAASTPFRFIDNLLLCLTHLFFGLGPVAEFRTRLTTSLDVEFVGTSVDSFFERKCFDRGLLFARWCWHGD